MSTELLTPMARFIGALNTDRTREDYSRHLDMFLKWRSIGVDDLLLQDVNATTDDIIKYLLELKDKGYSYSTRNSVSSAIRKFFVANKLILNWPLISTYVTQDAKIHRDRGYTAEEIQKLLSVADTKWKAIIYLLCSAGLRIGALPSLKFGDISKMKGHDVYKVTVYRDTKDEYYTFATPEAYTAINAYLDYRRRYGEVITSDSPLFRLDFSQRKKQTIQNAKPLSYWTCRTKIRELLLKTGMVTNHGNSGEHNEVAANHGFRKFFASQLENSDVSDFQIEGLLGHRTGLRGTYRKTPEKRLIEYLKAKNALTINPENRLQSKVEELEEKNAEIESLKREQQEFRNSVSKYMDSIEQKMKDRGIV
jgi:integrase